MSQKSSLIYSIIIIAISIFLGLMIGRYIVPERHIEVIDYGEEFYTAQLQKNLSTIDSLESVIKVQESIVDSFLNLRNQVQVEYIIKREEIRNLPLDSSVIILRNFIEEYEKDLVNSTNDNSFY
jgi:phospholipid N-methyltransferase